MDMVKVKTSGDFMLVDPQNSHTMVSHEAREVPLTHFVQERLDNGQLVKTADAGKATPSTKGEDRAADGSAAIKEEDQKAGEKAAGTHQESSAPKAKK